MLPRGSASRLVTGPVFKTVVRGRKASRASSILVRYRLLPLLPPKQGGKHLTHRPCCAVIGQMEPVDTSSAPQSLKAKVARGVTTVLVVAYLGAAVWNWRYGGPHWPMFVLPFFWASASLLFRSAGWTPKPRPLSMARRLLLWATVVALFIGFWFYFGSHRQPGVGILVSA
jgi:hypothetical protein